MSLKTYHGEKSAVIMMGIVIGVFVITYGMYLHCSFLILFDTTGMASCNDVKYKIPVLVLNSAINPLAYAFFKRDVNKEFRRLISINMFLKKGNQVKPSTHVFDSFVFASLGISSRRRNPEEKKEEKSRGGVLVARAYRKVLTVEIYSQHTKENLDLLD